MQQLISGFKGTINWQKYQAKVSIQAPNPYLDSVIDPSVQGVNTLFVLSFQNTDDRAVHTKHCLPTVEIKGYNVMIDGPNFFDQPLKNNLITYDNVERSQLVKEMIELLVVY